MSLTAIDAEYDALHDDLTSYFAGGGPLAVVKAPPGSGKTFTLIRVLAELVRRGLRVAVAAQTNNQADDIAAGSPPFILGAPSRGSRARR